MTGSPGPTPKQAVSYRFGPFVLDLDEGILTRDGRTCRIQHKAFELLSLLVRNPGRVLTRDDVVRALWPDTVVDFEHGLNTLMRKVRSALGDSASDPTFIETVPRRGYRFIAEVERVEEALDPGPATEPVSVSGPLAELAPRSTVPGRPSMGMLAGLMLVVVLAFLGDLSHGQGVPVPARDAGLQADFSRLVGQVEPCAWCRTHFSETGRLYDCAWCRARLAAAQ